MIGKNICKGACCYQIIYRKNAGSGDKIFAEAFLISSSSFFLILKTATTSHQTGISSQSKLVQTITSSPSICPDGVGNLRTFTEVSLGCVECNGTIYYFLNLLNAKLMQYPQS